MPSRRAFIQHGLAVSALAACPPAVHLALANTDERSRYFKVLFDRTHPSGTAFGIEAAHRGAPALAVGPEIGGVWMHHIEPRWKVKSTGPTGRNEAPIAIAGLTGGESLFCLELLARDYGVGTVYRVEHVPLRSGAVRHLITGPEPLMAWERRLATAGDRWSAVAAEMALGCPETLRPDARTPGDRGPRINFDLVDLTRQPDHAGPSLFSWVIAPRAVVGGRWSVADGCRLLAVG